MLPLSMSNAGEKLIVSRAAGSPETKKHLEDLGIVPGTEVRVVSAPGKGNLIIKVKDSTLAVTSKMAEKIFVTL